MGLNDVEYRLLEKGIIDLRGSVNEEMLNYVRECLKILESKGSPDIDVKITSPGGSCGVALIIWDMLRLYTGKKTGKVIGYAHSMAPVILQACDKRLCAMHARIMIHHIYQDEVSLDILRDSKKTQNILKEMEEEQGRIYRILCRSTKKRQAVIRKVCAERRFMTAKEALEFGLIDKII